MKQLIALGLVFLTYYALLETVIPEEPRGYMRINWLEKYVCLEDNKIDLAFGFQYFLPHGWEYAYAGARLTNDKQEAMWGAISFQDIAPLNADFQYFVHLELSSPTPKSWLTIEFGYEEMTVLRFDCSGKAAGESAILTIETFFGA